MGFCSSLFKTFFFIAFCWLGVTLWLFSRLNHELFEHKPPTEARSMKVDMECEGIKVIRKGFSFLSEAADGRPAIIKTTVSQKIHFYAFIIVSFYELTLSVKDFIYQENTRNRNPVKLSTRVFPPPFSSPRASQHFIVFQITWSSSKLHRLPNHRVSLQARRRLH